MHLPVVVGLANIEVVGRHPLDDTTILCGREPELHTLATFVASGLRAPTAFLLLRQPFRLLERGEQATTKDRNGRGVLDRLAPEIARYRERLTSKIDHVRLALLLGNDYPDLAAPVAVSEVVVEPFDTLLTGSSLAPQYSPLPEVTLNETMVQEASVWLAHVQQAPEAHVKAVQFGISRFLSAATSRQDARDGFVDAVICWDSLLGTVQGEVAFRITAALAWLVAPDDREERQQAFKDAKELYRRRSRIVHGSTKQPPAHEATADRDKALHICQVALRELFQRPALLASQNRAEDIVLDFLDDRHGS